MKKRILATIVGSALLVSLAIYLINRKTRKETVTMTTPTTREKKLSWKVTTSEMMEGNIIPDVVLAGCCNIVNQYGRVRNEGRDELGEWLTLNGISFYEVQITESTHGREYDWDIDGPKEKLARDKAKLRIYELRPEVISVVTGLEIMSDHNKGRRSIVWFHDSGENFIPYGLGDAKMVKADQELRKKVGPVLYEHLWAYANAGRQLRNELPEMIGGSPYVTIVKGDLNALIPEIRKALELS